VRSDVGSMDCVVAGAVIDHIAFFFAEASRRGRGSATLVRGREFDGRGAISMGLVSSVSGKTASVSLGVDGSEKSEDVALAAGENGQRRLTGQRREELGGDWRGRDIHAL